MNKKMYNLGFVLMITILFLLSFKEPKKLKVEGTIEDWNFILNVIDYSKIDPDQRIGARAFIYKQLANQIDTLTTTNKPKK